MECVQFKFLVSVQDNLNDYNFFKSLMQLIIDKFFAFFLHGAALTLYALKFINKI